MEDYSDTTESIPGRNNREYIFFRSEPFGVSPLGLSWQSVGTLSPFPPISMLQGFGPLFFCPSSVCARVCMASLPLNIEMGGKGDTRQLRFPLFSPFYGPLFLERFREPKAMNTTDTPHRTTLAVPEQHARRTHPMHT